MSSRRRSSASLDRLAGVATARWLPWVVAALLAVFTVSVWRSLVIRERANLEAAMRSQAGAMGDHLESELRSRVMAVVRLADRWAAPRREAVSDWRSDATVLLAQLPGYAVIFWIDTSSRIGPVVSLTGPAEFSAEELTGIVTPALLQKARGSRYALTSARLPSSDAGLVTVAPVLEDGKFRGWVAAVIDLHALLDVVWPAATGTDRSISISEGTRTLYQRPGPELAERVSQVRVDVNGLGWELRVAPGPQLEAEMRSPFPVLALVLGLFGSGLFGSVVALGQQAQRRARELKEINKALEAQIAERRRAEAAASDAHRRLEAVFRASPLAIFSLDTEGRVTSWNEAAARLFGWREEELIGRPVPVVAATEEGAALLPWERVLGGEPTATAEVGALRRDRTPVDVRLWAAAVADAAGSPAGVMVVAEDITERRWLELQLAQAQKMESIGRLAGGIAHDFNNVLTAILGHVDLALDGLDRGELPREDLGEVKRAAERAAALTRQLLAFGRRQVLQPRVLSLNEVVRDLERMLGRLIGEHIELVTDLSPRLAEVRADPSQIEQVIMNLAVNARDAMPEGGRLRIETANVEIAAGLPAEAGEVEAGAYVMLAVSDTGVGMDAATRERAFDPFFTTKEPGKGTGLGLSTVYGIVRQSEGYIWLESEEGEGTTVRIYLPRAEQPAAAPKMPPPSAPAAPEGTETVVLVEDDAAVRDLTSSILRRGGYTVLEAATPGEALAAVALREGPIHLLLTDVVMPEMSGQDLAKRLRVRHPELKVLYMSGYPETPGAVEAPPPTPGPVLNKPFTRDVVLRAVREALEQGPEPDSASE